MHPAGRSGRSGHPILASAALRLRAFDRNLICGEHYGQRSSKSAASTGRTHGSTDQPCITVKKTLANREPSTHGYSRPQTPLEANVRSGPGSRHCGAGYRPSFSGVRQSYLFGTPAGSIAAIQEPAPHDRRSAREHPPAGSLFGRRSCRRQFVLTERARHPGRPGGTEPVVEIGGWGSREMPMEISSLVEVSKHPAGYPCVTRSRWCRHGGAPDYLTYNTFRGKREGGRGSV